MLAPLLRIVLLATACILAAGRPADAAGRALRAPALAPGQGAPLAPAQRARLHRLGGRDAPVLEQLATSSAFAAAAPSPRSGLGEAADGGLRRLAIALALVSVLTLVPLVHRGRGG
jgi:hypothetical protein